MKVATQPITFPEVGGIRPEVGGKLQSASLLFCYILACCELYVLWDVLSLALLKKGVGGSVGGGQLTKFNIFVDYTK